MKSFLFSLILLPLISLGQLTSHSFNHGGITREYLTYVPASYNGTTPVPVVLALHGLGDNMNNFAGIGMNYVADTANFIVVTPQAIVETMFTNQTAWNSGAGMFGFTLNANIDDVGFLSELIDTISANYNVDLQRVFACGFSMGGFMSQRLACELNNKVAAIASVAGTIGSELNCSPGRAVPVCHFHGTGDATVPYTGNQFGMDVTAMISFWELNNGCSSGAINTSLPDIFADNYTVEHSLYTSCDDNVEIELYRVDSADHIWLGPTNDIFYTTEIWEFFLKHSNSTVSINEIESRELISIMPNPAKENAVLSINLLNETEITILVDDITGKNIKVEKYQLSKGQNKIAMDVRGFEAGVYLISGYSDKKLFTKKLVVE